MIMGKKKWLLTPFLLYGIGEMITITVFAVVVRGYPGPTKTRWDKAIVQEALASSKATGEYRILYSVSTIFYDVKHSLVTIILYIVRFN